MKAILVHEQNRETAANVLKGLELALGFAEKHGYMVVVKRGPAPNSFDFVMMESSTPQRSSAEVAEALGFKPLPENVHRRNIGHESGRVNRTKGAKR